MRLLLFGQLGKAQVSGTTWNLLTGSTIFAFSLWPFVIPIHRTYQRAESDSCDFATTGITISFVVSSIRRRPSGKINRYLRLAGHHAFRCFKIGRIRLPITTPLGKCLGRPNGAPPPAVGHSILNSGTTKRGSASMLSRDSAPAPDPGLKKHRLNRSPLSPTVNSFLRSSFGVNGPPK